MELQMTQTRYHLWCAMTWKIYFNQSKIGGIHLQCVCNHCVKFGQCLNKAEWKLLDLQITQTRYSCSASNKQKDRTKQFLDQCSLLVMQAMSKKKICMALIISILFFSLKVFALCLHQCIIISNLLHDVRKKYVFP